jgi:hypothetical protein
MWQHQTWHHYTVTPHFQCNRLLVRIGSKNQAFLQEQVLHINRFEEILKDSRVVKLKEDIYEQPVPNAYFPTEKCI